MEKSWAKPHSGSWVHALAVLTVLAAFPLLFLGAEVTTKGVGMADDRPVVSPFQAIAEFLEGNRSLGWAIEHSHRLAGWIVGCCGILLSGALWLREPRRWVCWLGTSALGLIIIQGLLGIFRVKFNALVGPTLAWVHGCFAQIVFATLVSVALVTSGGWAAQFASAASTGLRRWSTWVAALVFGQLVLGGMVRHQGGFLVARAHLLGAFATVAALVWLTCLARDASKQQGETAAAPDSPDPCEPAPTLRRHSGSPCWFSVGVLCGLLVLQVVLGVEAWLFWMKRVFDPSAAAQESAAVHWLRSGHYVVGTMIFATTVVLALKARRATGELS